MTGKKLAWGYTTGTCAQAATKAAAEMLFSQVHMDQVEVTIPNGETARFPVEEIRFEKKDGSLLSVSCGIKKDSGDDPDITDGVLVKSRVERIRGSHQPGSKRDDKERTDPGGQEGRV